MIRIGSFVCTPRARPKKLAYQRSRKKRRLPSFLTLQSKELPMATLRHRGARYLFADWLRARWMWIRPRTIPLAVAFVGMLAVLGSMHYLSTPHGTLPTAAAAKTTHVQIIDTSLRGTLRLVP